MRRRAILVAVGAALAAVGIGTAMAFTTPAAHHDPVVSRWSGGGNRLVFGASKADPGRGFVRLRQGRGKPYVFTTPEGAGALELTSASADGDWTFRTRNGSLASLSTGWDVGVRPLFQFLGRQLDPANLGPIGSRGVAVETWWWEGNGNRRALVLVEQTSGRHGSFGNGWKVVGYLPDFTTPRLAAQTAASPGGPWLESTRQLNQPLRGPDGRNYAIDVKGRRLVPVAGAVPAATLQAFKLGDCTTWPGSNGASYRACGSAITLRRPNQAATTLFRRPADDFIDRDGVWTALQPSPNGRWLLLENANEICSTFTKAEFLPARGGRLAEVFPGSPADSEALGWLPDNTALVAGQPQTCGGSGPAGIYQIRPGTTGSPSTYQLVLATYGADATTWGFGIGR